MSLRASWNSVAMGRRPPSWVSGPDTCAHMHDIPDRVTPLPPRLQAEWDEPASGMTKKGEFKTGCPTFTAILPMYPRSFIGRAYLRPSEPLPVAATADPGLSQRLP